MNASAPLFVGDEPLRIEAVEELSRRHIVRVQVAEAAKARTSKARDALQLILSEGGTVYGVTTGFGDSCQTAVGGDLIAELPRNLYRFHGCGVGDDFTLEQTRAILLARLASLCQGFSGVRPALLDQLAALLNHDILPCIPSLGSVGASGDLTPLSYVAATLAGEQDVVFDGQRLSAWAALERARLAPLALEPKESLAVMNGTSAMTGVAALCVPRALHLARWASALTAAASDTLQGQPRHFDERIFQAKAHPGQALSARWIREDLEFERARADSPARVQDRYSLRCAPHVIGVLLDVLPHIIRLVEVELNGANDNPLIDPLSGDVLHGGNFYGGHICSAMDTLKAQVANIADLLDRQLALLCNPDTNHGLPGNLVGAPVHKRSAHHGFKAMQITTSALAAEAAKLTMPASVFSRSTENHNQDKVSMGTIAARDCVRILDLTETIAAIVTLACAQAVDLRHSAGCHGRALELHQAVRAVSPLLEEDRALRADIDAVLALARERKLPVGSHSLDEIRTLESQNRH
jgi:histidine ammonia-lyase